MFQFQYGTIKRLLLRCELRICYSFNSNMVQLKVEARKTVKAAYDAFQFQYGTIKSIQGLIS